MTPDEFQKAYGKLVAAAWADEDVKKRLLDDPKKVLEEYGVEVPESGAVHILEETAEDKYLILPLKSQDVAIESLSERNSAEFI